MNHVRRIGQKSVNPSGFEGGIRVFWPRAFIAQATERVGILDVVSFVKDQLVRVAEVHKTKQCTNREHNPQAKPVSNALSKRHKSALFDGGGHSLNASLRE